MGTFTVYNVYSGEEAKAEPDRFIHLDDVKKWISASFGISADRQLILTAKSAAHLKLDYVVDNQHCFVFDRALISASPRSIASSGSGSNSISSFSDSRASSPVPSVTPPPDMGSLSTRDFLAQEAQWAQNALTSAKRVTSSHLDIHARLNVISAGLDLAMMYMMRYSNALNDSYKGKNDFAVAFEKDLKVTKEWGTYLKLLDRIDLIDSTAKLSSWIDADKVEKTFYSCEHDHNELKVVLAKVADSVKKIMDSSQSLADLVARSLHPPNNSTILADPDCQEIVQDIEAIVAKISTHRDSQSPSQRTLNVHVREFDPQIVKLLDELNASHHALKKQKDLLQKLVITSLSQLSRIQSNTADARARLMDIGHRLRTAEDSRAYVARVIDMPFLYGMYLIETLRRHEWMCIVKECIKGEAEKLGHWHEDEKQRRKAWEKTYQPLLLDNITYLDSHMATPNIELNMTSPSPSTGSVRDSLVRSDVEKYIAGLNTPELRLQYRDLKEELARMYEVLTETSRDLKNTMDSRKFHPLRREAIGLLSAHALGDGVSSSAGFQNTSSCEEDKKKIRSYESRIRKLEDLLHKQLSQKLRPDLDLSSRGATPVAEAQQQSQSPSRPGSLRSITEPQFSNASSPAAASPATGPRSTTSASAVSPNPNILSRLHFLESQNAKLEEDKARLESQLEAANLVKADLLANMSSQESEFAQERKQLMTEIEDAKRQAESAKRQIAEEAEKYESSIQEKDVRIEVLEEESASFVSKFERLDVKTRDLSQRLLTSFQRSCEVLELMGLQAFNDGDSGFRIARVKGLRKSSHHNNRNSAKEQSPPSPDVEEGPTPLPAPESNSAPTNGPPTRALTRIPSEGTARLLHWMSTDSSSDEDREDDRYNDFLAKVYVDYDMFRDSIAKRFREVEHLARKLQKDVRHGRDELNRLQDESRQKLALRSFKVGDLALFLPTRDPTRTPNPWAAFNINAPHYFLKQEDVHQLEHREYLVARITKVDERVVNRAIDDVDNNLFDLSDGLKWHLIEATPEQG